MPPPQPDPRIAQAQRLAAAGDAAGALAQLRPVLALSPGREDAVALHTSICTSLGRHADAVAALRRAVAAKPNAPALLCDLAVLLEQQGDLDEADELLTRALDIAPNDPATLAARADYLLTIGRAEDAERLLAPHAENADVRLALTWAHVCERVGRPAEGADALRPHAGDPRLSPVGRRGVLFRLAALLDKAGQYDDAFDAAQEANAVTDARRRRSFDPDLHRRSIDLLIERWTPEATGALPVGDAMARTPVFIVGMPRSGTSLVEQILASHPEVHAAGERSEVAMIVERLGAAELPTAVPHMHRLDALTADLAPRAAGAYLEVMRALSPNAPRVTDKRPDNFLHLGLISRLFPTASVIHIERNPLDVALSCYFLDFYGPYAWADDLDHIGAYIEDERRLMRHWRDALNLPMLSLRYEDLAREPEPHIRRLIDFAGLEWHDACLRAHESTRIVRTSSNEQVRQPIHTGAIERWRNYEQHLEPLIKRFQ